jgi:hypothetical protein
MQVLISGDWTMQEKAHECTSFILNLKHQTLTRVGVGSSARWQLVPGKIIYFTIMIFQRKMMRPWKVIPLRAMSTCPYQQLLHPEPARETAW